ncbi:hypothetical protein [Paenibacillus oryzisoli]|uniref:hypothetical protein n=1 Tax=Paenibacillus oryzisoli TaxID=1850517 RepID=UPI0012FC85B8|nr:hypothetical protein [Paenibacillus oryzisoli]
MLVEAYVVYSEQTVYVSLWRSNKAQVCPVGGRLRFFAYGCFGAGKAMRSTRVNPQPNF